MKTKRQLVSYALAVIMLLSIMVVPNLGPLDVDVVSAATGETTTPTTTKPTTSTTNTAPQTAAEITRTLKLGSRGNDVKLLQTWLNNNGYKLKIDGIFGKQTQAAVKDYQEKNGFPVDGVAGTTLTSKLNPASAKTTIKIGRAEYAAHGTKCFTVAVVAMAGDKIAAASLDDYQFMAKDTSIAVPNSYKDFGTYYKDPTRVLASKLANAVAYSANMAKSGSTVAIDKNLAAVEAYTVGKTIAELEAALKANTPEQMVDAVSGATLVDTHGYISAIVAAAKAAKESSSLQVEAAQLKNVKMLRTEYAAHGTKCFTVPVVLMLGDKILAASLDDYQFMAKDTSIAVPNSDKDFGTFYKDPTRVLSSKRANAAAYSANMAKSGSTVPIDKNLDIIQAYVAGKTVGELEAILKKNTPEQMVDAVSGATLVDTHGYISAIVAAAKGIRENKVAVQIGKVEYAAHGTKCFTVASVAISGDKILVASLDDYQFMAKDTSVAVPNSDKDFGTYYKDPARVLASKLANAATYSANMAKSGSTVPIDKNFEAIKTYVAGKTITELEATLKATEYDKMVDAVSGATLVDTHGYITAIVEAAKAAKKNSTVSIDASALSTLKLGKAEYAAHGTKCFTMSLALVAGDKIVAAYLDDYQFMAKDTSIAVPNSDKDFGGYYKDPARVLASKRANAAAYSANMAKSGSTVSIDKNLDAIQAYAAGKTIAELEATLKATEYDKMVDAVSGATLVDTHGYTTAIVEAAKAAK